MLKFVALAASLMFASAASAQQSLQTLHTRVPAPPATAAAAPAWLASPELAALRKQIKDQRDLRREAEPGSRRRRAAHCRHRPAAASTSSAPLAIPSTPSR